MREQPVNNNSLAKSQGVGIKIELWVNGKEGFVEPVLVAASASSTEI